MLYTRDLIFLAFPKTGTSWVRSVIREVGTQVRYRHSILPEALLSRNYFFEQMVVDFHAESAHHHGNRRRIHENHRLPWRLLVRLKNKRDRLIVTVLRNPIERFESAFNYRHWESFGESRRLGVLKEFPSFPNWNRIDFYEYSCRHHEKEISAELNFIPRIQGVGPLSWYFIFFYASEDFIEKMKQQTHDSIYEVLNLFITDVEPILFLDQRDLNGELASLLQSYGYIRDENSIRSAEKVNESIKSKEFISAEVAEFEAYFLHQEEFLFLAYRRLLENRIDSGRKSMNHVK